MIHGLIVRPVLKKWTDQYYQGACRRAAAIQSNTDLAGELPNVDLTADEIAEFFAAGGPSALRRLWRTIRRKRLPDTFVETILEAFSEAVRGGPEKDSGGSRIGQSHQLSFVGRAKRLSEVDRLNSALDLVYDSIDEMLRTGKLSQLDSILATIPVNELSRDLLIGFLTATLPARSRLPARKKLFADTMRSLSERGEFEEGLLTGLE